MAEGAKLAAVARAAEREAVATAAVERAEVATAAAAKAVVATAAANPEMGLVVATVAQSMHRRLYGSVPPCWWQRCKRKG